MGLAVCESVCGSGGKCSHSESRPGMFAFGVAVQTIDLYGVSREDLHS